MSLNLDRIFETRQYAVWCFQCNDCITTDSDFKPIYSKKEARKEYTEAGWKHINGKGYLCPDCQKKEK